MFKQIVYSLILISILSIDTTFATESLEHSNTDIQVLALEHNANIVQFLDLPDELLTHIMLDTDPRAIKYLAAMCRRLREIAGTFFVIGHMWNKYIEFPKLTTLIPRDDNLTPFYLMEGLYRLSNSKIGQRFLEEIFNKGQDPYQIMAIVLNLHHYFSVNDIKLATQIIQDLTLLSAEQI